MDENLSEKALHAGRSWTFAVSQDVFFPLQRLRSQALCGPASPGPPFLAHLLAEELT